MSPVHAGRHLSALDQITPILERTETEIRAVITSCLTAHRYVDVALAARIVEDVAALRLRVQGGSDLAGRIPVNGPDGAGDGDDPRGRDQPVPSRTRTAGGKTSAMYPQFRRDGQRIVKIGWSKRDRQEYQHKATYSAVLATCRALREKVGTFGIDELLPLKDESGTDVPSYQVYLVVAWLRQLGFVDRNGNDGYTMQASAMGEGAITRQWHLLAEGR